MKNMFSILLVLLIATGCSKDEEKGPDTINHVGEQWKVISGDYNLVDVTIGGGFKQGSAANIGSFYLNGGTGSFDLNFDGIHKEDVFSYTEDNGSISIISVSQNVGSGANVSQSVIAMNGEMTATTIELNGTVVKQATTGSSAGTFTLSLTDLVLEKQ